MSKPNIICVDDEIIVLYSLREQLESMFGSDYNIEITESAHEALHLLEELLENNMEVPIVIADYIMPDVKGDELLKYIREMNSRTVAILLTGQASLTGIKNAVNQADVFRFISKPWERENLYTIVSQALNYYEEKLIEEKNKKLREINHELAKVANKRSEQLAKRQNIPEFDSRAFSIQKLSEDISTEVSNSLLLIKSGIDTAFELQNNIYGNSQESMSMHMKGVYHFYEMTASVIDNLICAFNPNIIKTWLQPAKSQELQGIFNNISSMHSRISENVNELSNKIREMEPQLKNKNERIIAWDDEEILIFALEDALFFTSEDKNTMVVTKKGKYKMRDMLDSLENRLSTHNFFRCHRSYLINLDHVSKIIPWIGYSYIAKFEGFPYEVPISKYRLKKMKEVLGI